MDRVAEALARAVADLPGFPWARAVADLPGFPWARAIEQRHP